MDIKKRLKESVLYETHVRSRKDWRSLFLTMILDALFIASLFILNWLLTILFPNPQNTILTPNRTVGLVVFVLLAYFFLTVLLYSLFKYAVMARVKRFFTRKKHHCSISEFSKFFVANALLAAIYFIAFAFFGGIFIMTVKVTLLQLVRNALLVVIGFFWYLSVNTYHSLFMQQDLQIRKLLRRTFDSVFNRLKIYYGLVAWSLVAFFALAAVYYVFDWFVLLVLGSSINQAAVFKGYAVVNTIVVAFFALGLLAFNRAYVYNIVMRAPKNLKHK